MESYFLPSDEFRPITKREKEVAELFADPGKYKLKMRIGEGIFGTVYLVETEKGNFAVKLIRAVDVKDKKYSIILKEAYISQGLDLKHTVKSYGLVKITRQKIPYFGIIMDYFMGLTFDVKNLPAEPQFLEYMLGVANALRELHSHQIVHMDLKQENAICSPSNEIKLLDLGLSCRFDQDKFSRLDRCDRVRGTPYYIAPEIYAKNYSDLYRADIWSFGVFFYKMLYNKYPFDSDEIEKDLAILDIIDLQKKGPIYPSKDKYGVSISIIQECLAYDSTSRPLAENLYARILSSLVTIRSEIRLE